jgi:hypothetical protein
MASPEHKQHESLAIGALTARRPTSALKASFRLGRGRHFLSFADLRSIIRASRFQVRFQPTSYSEVRGIHREAGTRCRRLWWLSLVHFVGRTGSERQKWGHFVWWNGRELAWRPCRFYSGEVLNSCSTLRTPRSRTGGWFPALVISVRNQPTGVYERVHSRDNEVGVGEGSFRGSVRVVSWFIARSKPRNKSRKSVGGDLCVIAIKALDRGDLLVPD